MHLHDFVLVDVLEDMRCIQQNDQSPDRRDDEEEVKLQAIDDHRHVLPVLADLRQHLSLCRDKEAKLTDLNVLVFTPEMLGDELDRFRRSICLWRQEETVDRVLVFRGTRITARIAVPAARVDVAVRVVARGRRLGHGIREVLFLAEGVVFFGGRTSLLVTWVVVDAHGRHVHHPAKSSLFGSTHQQERRKVLQENSSDPIGHLMSARTPKVPVDDDDSREDGDAVHEESEEQVLGDEGQDEGRGRQDLGDQQQEDDQRQQDRYA